MTTCRNCRRPVFGELVNPENVLSVLRDDEFLTVREITRSLEAKYPDAAATTRSESNASDTTGDSGFLYVAGGAVIAELHKLEEDGKAIVMLDPVRAKLVAEGDILPNFTISQARAANKRQHEDYEHKRYSGDCRPEGDKYEDCLRFGPDDIGTDCYPGAADMRFSVSRELGVPRKRRRI